MIIQKFGGTSMGSASSILGQVCPVVQRTSKDDSPLVVVVSAMTGVTSLLLAAANKAASENVICRETLEAIRDKHVAVISSSVITKDERAAFEAVLDKELGQLENLLSAIGIIQDLPTRSQDAIIAVGEILSAHLLVASLNSLGSPAEYVDTTHIVPSTLRYESDEYWDKIEALFRDKLQQISRGRVPVVPGYFGDTALGIIQSVGRGYSDYSASLIGSALGASEIQIWTDVDGVLSANPKIVPDAFILDRISYDEMAELSQFGAKVLHPFSVRPAVKSGIPMRILNTFNPDCTGTLIEVPRSSSRKPFKSIAYKKGITVVRITTPRMLMSHGFLAQIGDILARHHISIDLIATSEVSISFTMDDGSKYSPALQEDLARLGDVSVSPAQSIISVVGAEIAECDDLMSRTFTALHRAGIKVNLISFGDAKINLSLIVDDAACDGSVQALHDEFFSKRS
jgi:aspartate kinase